MNRIPGCFFWFVLLLTPALLAKSNLRVWTSAGVSYGLNKKINLGFEQDLRLDDSGREFDETLSDFSLSLKLSKAIRLGLGYRFELGGKSDALKQGQRTHVQMRIKQKLGPFWGAYRLRLQYHLSDVERAVRQRLNLGWDLSKTLRPRVGLELFSDELKKLHFPLNKFRWTAMLSYRMTKSQALELFSHMHQDLKDDDPLEYVAGLNYRYRLRP